MKHMNSVILYELIRVVLFIIHSSLEIFNVSSF